MATGSGKSLCYQMPGLILQKPIVVISPLISLMNDQVAALESKGISAVAVTSEEKNTAKIEAATRGEVQMIYM